MGADGYPESQCYDWYGQQAAQGPQYQHAAGIPPGIVATQVANYSQVSSTASSSSGATPWMTGAPTTSSKAPGMYSVQAQQTSPSAGCVRLMNSLTKKKKKEVEVQVEKQQGPIEVSHQIMQVPIVDLVVPKVSKNQR